MRPVSGDDLVTAALQSSLARAQKNYKFNHHKVFKGSTTGGEQLVGFGKKGKLKKEGDLLPFSSSKGKGGLKFQSEFDLWREQTSELTFVSEGYTNGATVPDNIECLNATSASSKRKASCASATSGRNLITNKRQNLLQSRNCTEVEEKDSLLNKSNSSSSGSVTTENSFELLKELKENRKEKKKLVKLRKGLLKRGYSVEEIEELINRAKCSAGSGGGVGAIVERLRNTLSPGKKEGLKDPAILKQQLLGKNKNFKMKDISENNDDTTTTTVPTATVRPRPNTPSSTQPQQQISSSSSPAIVNGGIGNSSSSNNNNNGSNSSSSSHSHHTQHQLPQPKRILYPREKIIPGYIEKMPVGAGFFNMGNSCYLNASLQAVFHVPAFINWLKQDVEHRKHCQDNGSCIICAMKKTLDSATNRQNNMSIRPVEIINRLRSICRHFSHGRQEDAHEFLRYLFESMERSYLAAINCLRLDNRSKETNPLGQIFGGYIRTEVTCLKCHYVSTTFQPTAELQLDIRHVTTLEDAICNHFKKERLENNDYKCEKCRTISQATKQFSLEVPPIVLCLQLKRFTLYGTKIAKRIHCNQYLDMSKFIHKSKQLNGFSNLRYRLVALVTHLGSSPNCGHYTAIAQAANGNFYQFDDSYVHQIPLQTALNNDAYVIIYEMDSKSKKSPDSSPKIANTSGSNYTNSVNKLGYPSSTASSSSTSPSTAINSIFPKKIPSATFSKVSTLPATSKLVQNSENEPKLQGSLCTSESLSSGSPNGKLPQSGVNNILKPVMERKMISFGIRPSGTTGTPKINVLKVGVPLTNSSKLIPASSASSNNVVSSNSTKNDSQIKLVPYNDDENEESDKDENSHGGSLPTTKRLSSPESHKKQSPKRNSSEVPVITPPKSPKPLSHQSIKLQSSAGPLGSSKTTDSNSTPSKNSDKRKSPENDESKDSRSHKRRSPSSSSTSSSRSEESTERGNSKRKREEEKSRSSSERKLSSQHSPSEHGSYKRDRERDHRDSYSQERERERRRNRNPSRSRSPSVDHRDKRGSSSDPRFTESCPTQKVLDVTRFKQENSILGWNGQKSILSKSLEEDRKRSNEKSLDDEYDDEFDQGRVKKVRRSRSLPKETESGGGENRFQVVDEKKKQVQQWSSILNGYGPGFRRNSGPGSTPETKSWLNGDNNNDDSPRHRRNLSRPLHNGFSRPRHSSSNGSHSSGNYSRNNSHGRSPFRTNGHLSSNGGSHYRSQSQNSYHHSGNKHWSNDRNRH